MKTKSTLLPLTLLGSLLLIGGCSIFRQKSQQADSSLFVGEHKEYHSNGQLREVEHYKNGLLNGETTSYYEDEEPNADGTFAPHGQLSMRGFYHLDAPHGTWTYYYPSGQLQGIDYYGNGEERVESRRYYESTYATTQGGLNILGFYQAGRREGRWNIYFANGQLWKVENYKEGEHDGEKLTYYEDVLPTQSGAFAPHGQLYEQGFYRMGLLDSTWTYYHPNGQVGRVENYRLDKQEGEWRDYNEKGVLIFQGSYRDDKPDGEHSWYYSSGILMEVAHYSKGIMHGEQRTYHPNGQVATIGVYNQGVEEEEERLYDDEGNLLGTRSHRGIEGIDIGMLKEDTQVDEEDQLDFIVQLFTEDQREGEVKDYYDSGELKIVTPRKRGEIHGEMKVFYRDGSLARSVSYANGKEDGKLVAYNKNGTLQMEGSYKNGERDGYWAFYNEDGTLVEEVSYKNGMILPTQP